MTNYGNGAGDSGVGDARVEKAMKQEGGSGWQNQAAQECWSKCGGGATASADSSMKMAQGGGPEDKNNWMEGRVQQRLKEEAGKFGLDDKANWDDVIKARAAKGTHDNEGRVDEMRKVQAVEYGLDPNASWEAVNRARVQHRIDELEGKYGQKK